MTRFPSWPAWRFGPAGQRAIFAQPEDVPLGWADTPAAFSENTPVAEQAPAPDMPRRRGRPPKVRP